MKRDDPTETGREMAAVWLTERQRKAQHMPPIGDDGYYRDHEAQAANDYVEGVLAEVVPITIRKRYQALDPGPEAA